MFARKLRLSLRTDEGERPVPLEWMERFFLRDFTGFRAFDETLPVQDGLLEASFAVQASEVRERFAAWLCGRKMIPPEAELLVSEVGEVTA